MGVSYISDIGTVLDWVVELLFWVYSEFSLQVIVSFEGKLDFLGIDEDLRKKMVLGRNGKNVGRM